MGASTTTEPEGIVYSESSDSESEPQIQTQGKMTPFGTAMLPK